MDSAFAELRQRELLRLLVHEIRNPVAAALYSTELLNRNLSKIPDAPPTMPSVVGTARASIFSVENILSQVARFARAATDAPMTTTPRELVQWWQARTDIDASKFVTEFGDGSDRLIRGHIDRLAVCLDALVRNAVTAQQNSTSTEPVRIVTGFDALQNHGKISVIDNGHGITDTILPKLCEAFVTEAPDSHLGLGLKLSKSIGMEYGAKIVLTSKHEPTQFDFQLTPETLS